MIGNVSRRLPLVEWAARLGGLLALCFSASALAAPQLSLSLIATDPTGTEYTPGSATKFEFTVTNGNTEGVTGVTDMNVELELPAGVTRAASPPTCSVTEAGTSPVSSCGTEETGNDLFSGVALGVGGRIKITFSLNFDIDAVGDKVIKVNLGGMSGTNSPQVPIVMTPPEADPAVSVAKLSGIGQGLCPGPTDSTHYTPGCSSRYQVVVTNNKKGNADTALSFELVEWDNNIYKTISTDHTQVRWSCSVSGNATCPAGITPLPTWCPSGAASCGEGLITNRNVRVNGGQSHASNKLTFTVELAHDSGELVPTLGMRAKIESSSVGNTPDVNPNNNSDEEVRSLLRKVKLTVNKSARDLSGNVITAPIDSGTPFEYWIDVKNEGPSDIGNGSTSTFPSLALTDAFDDRLRGVDIDGVCEVDGDGPPCWRYCSSTLNGPANDADGVVMPDECPAGALVEGRDDLNHSVLRLKAGTAVRLLTRVKADNASTTSFQLSNTAEVDCSEPPGGAPVPPGESSLCSAWENLAIDFDHGMPVKSTANLTVKAQDPYQLSVSVASPASGQGQQGVAGEERTWIIRVSNLAGVMSPEGDVRSQFPLYSAVPGTVPGLIPGSISWQCKAEGNACCNTVSGQCDVTVPQTQDALDERNVRIAPGASVVYTVTGRIDPRSPHGEHLTFSAEAIHSSDSTSEVFEGSNQLEIQRSAVLRVSKQLTDVSEDPGIAGGYRAEYEVRVGNQGPSYAPIVLTDPFDGSSPDYDGTGGTFDWNNGTWTCSVSPAGQFEGGSVRSRCNAQNPGTTASGSGKLTGTGADAGAGLVPGGELVYRITVPVPAPNGDNRIINVARVDGPAGDVGVIHSAVANLTSYLWSDVRLRVTKDDGLQVAHPGTAHQYGITVVNEGRDDAFDVSVRDVVPPTFQDVSWTCSAQSPVPGDLTVAFGSDNAPISVGEASLRAVVASGDGAHIYALGDGALYVFHRNAVPGLGYGDVSKSPIDAEFDGMDDGDDSGATVQGLADAVDLAISPDGRAVYVLSQSGLLLFNRVSNSASPTYGTLSFGGQFPFDGQHSVTSPQRLVVSETHVYVSDSEGSIAVFKRDPSTGSPAWLDRYANGVPEGASAMAISATGGHLFVASRTSSAVVRFPIRPASDGANAGRLDTANAISFASNIAKYQDIRDIALAANGTDLYLLAGNDVDGGESEPRIGYLAVQGAALVARATYPDDSTPEAAEAANRILQHATRIALAPDGEHLIGVSPGTVDDDGSLVFSLRRNPYTGALNGRILEGDDIGFEQVLHQSADNSQPENLIDESVALAVSSDNRHVFIVSARTESVSTGTLLALTRRAPDPVLGFVEHDRQGDELPGSGSAATVSNMTAPTDVLVLGNHVYAISLQDSAISVFERHLPVGVTPVPAGQHLVWKRSWRNGEDGITGMARPEHLATTPDGRFLFVTSVDNDTLAIFERNVGDGGLTFVASFKNGTGGVTGLLGAAGMAAGGMGGNYDLYVAAFYDSAIGHFRYNGLSGTWAYAGVMRAGNGVTGLGGIRDLALSQDGGQLVGVGSTANSVVVFDRSVGNGGLTFRQSLSLGANQRPVAVAFSGTDGDVADAHVYVAAQNGNSVHVLQRVLDPTSPMFGTVRRIGGITNGTGGVSAMLWPRDIAVSADGKQVYVVAQSGNSLLAFNRYNSVGNSNYGLLMPLETRTDNVDGVRGLASPYAVAVSSTGSHIYVVGFDSDAIASFSVGSASSCSAEGVGDIDDSVTIRAGGAVSYVIRSTIRPDAVGTLSNTVEVRLPPAPGEDEGVDVCSVEADEQSVCTDTTELRTSAGLTLTKTNNQTTAVPGTTVTYDVTVRNAGPGNVTGLDDPSRAAVSDLFGCIVVGGGVLDCSNSPFEQDSIAWTCSATGSGALDFVGALRGNEPGVNGSPQPPHLTGVSGLALIGGTHLAAASVSDDAVAFFRRNALTGALSYESEIEAGSGMPLAGARSVATSADGTRLYVVSRVSDSLSVFDLAVDGVTGTLAATLRATALGTDIGGLDQALHLIVLPSGTAGTDHVYVAAANSHAVSAFSYTAGDSAFTHLGTWFNNQGGVTGLADVEYLVASPDGNHVYALSGSGASVTLFERNSASGLLTFRSPVTGASLGVALEGVSSGSFDAEGEYLYLTASIANRVVVLRRVNDPGAGTGIYGNLSLASSIGQDQTGAQALGNPRRVLVSPDGQHLYVTSQGTGAVAWFSIHPASGALGYLGMRNDGSAGIDGMAGATGMVLDPQLGQLYVAGTLSQAIAQFSRQSDSWCPPSGTGPLDRVGVNIAAGGQIAFRISAQVSSSHSGDLVNVAGVEWVSHGTQAGCSPVADPGESNCASTAEDTDTQSSSADLAITKDDGLAEYDGLAGAMALAGYGDNIYAAAAGDNAIGVFLRTMPDPDAEESAARAGLVFLDAVRSGDAGITGLSNVVDVVVSDDGAQVYAASPVDNTVVAFSRDADGFLTPLDMEQHGVLGVTGLSGARALALSPDGVHLYAAGNLVNALAVFKRDADEASAGFGKLDFVVSVQNAVDGVSGLAQPVAVTVSPDGKHVYALGSGSIAAFARNTNSGSANYGRLTFVASYTNGGGIIGLDDVRSLLLSNDGRHLYVLGATAGTLVHFLRNTENGTLSFVERIAQSELIGATKLRLGPDGVTLYAVATAADAIVAFTLGEDSGTPKLAGIVADGDPIYPETQYPVIGGLDGVSDVWLAGDAGTPSGFLYASASIDGALSAFRTEASASSPTYLDSMFDGLGGVAPGDTLTYTIVATNHGPSDVIMDGSGNGGARVTDIFPDTFHSVSWTCVALSAGAGCQANDGEGDIDTKVSLPAGGSVRFQAVAQVSSKAAGRLINTATISSQNLLDPNLENNSATDDDTVLSPRMDLSIEVDECPSALGQPCEDADTAIPGGSIVYRVEAFNRAGPSYAAGAIVTDSLPSALYNVSWTCEAKPQAGLLSVIQPPQAQNGVWRAAAGDSLGQHVYVVGTRDGKGVVVQFERNAQSGLLTEVDAWSEGDPAGSTTVRGLAGAADVALSPDGRFLYVAGRDADAVAVFGRDASSGELTWKAQVRDGEFGVDGIGGVATLAISPDGRHLYAGGASDQAIAVFAINATTGLLTQASVVRQGVNGVNGLNGVADLAFNEAGTALFAVAGTNRSLTAFRRTVASGALAHAVSIEDGEPDQPVSLLRPVAVLFARGNLFVADGNGGMVSEVRYSDVDNVASFELVQEMSQSAAPAALAYVPDQERLYVAGMGSLRLYSLLPETARLLEQYDATFSSVFTEPSTLVVPSDGRHLYAAARMGGIGAYLREYGSRCALQGAGAIGVQQVDIAPGGSVEFTVSADIFANASGDLVYSAGVDPRILAYESDISDNRDEDVDHLTPVAELVLSKSTDFERVIAGLPVQYRIDVSNHGVSDALAALIDDQLPLFPDAPGGMLAGSGEWGCAVNPPLLEASRIPVSIEPRLKDMVALAHTPDGTRLFGVSRSGNALIDMKLAADGSVKAITRLVDGDDAGGTPIAGLAGASYVAVSPDGKHLYVTGATSNSILGFAIEDDGLVFVQKLTSGSGGVAGLQGATFVLVSGDGRHVYTAAVPSSVNNSAIALFQRDPLTGMLTFDERIQDGLGTFLPDSNVIRGVRRLHLTADGSSLYAVSTVSQSLARFAVDPGTGRLSYQGVMRATGTNAVPALAGARDLVATPGDTQFYVLGSGHIARFNRAINGSVAFAESTPLPGTESGTAIAIDAYGSRLYLTDAAGTVHMYWRRWADGALELRQSLAAPAPGAVEALLHVPSRTDVYLASAGAEGALTQLDERAISLCLRTEGSEADFPVAVDLGVEGWSAIDFSARVHPSARGVLVNTALAAVSDGSDPDESNNVDVVELPIDVVSDLSITKTGPETGIAGGNIEYTITVSNAGPSDALGIHVRDLLEHPAFLEADWTCTPSGDSTCQASGTNVQEVDVLGDLHVGDTFTVVVSVHIDPAYIGPVSNGAFVVPEPGATDPTPDDHEVESPVVTQIERVADLAVSKTNGVTQTIAGAVTNYEIVVANLGLSDAPDVRVRDLLPPELTFAHWTCTAAGGADCGVPAGSGSINQIVSIPAGASLTYHLTATVRSSAIGELTNSASAEVLAPGSDPDVTNNVATDTDEILIQSDVGVVVLAPDRYDPQSSQPMPFDVVVTNHGLSDASGVVATVDFSHSVWQHAMDCTPSSAGTHFVCEIGTLAAGESVSFPFALTQLPATPAALTWSAAVNLASPDPQPANNSASGSIEMATGVDLAVSISDNRDKMQPGDTTTFTITVRNIGSVDASGSRLYAPLPDGYLGGSWTCEPGVNVTCGLSGTGGIDDHFDLPGGRVLVYRMTVLLDPAIDQGSVAFVEQTAEVSTDPSQVEVSVLNNIARDRNAVVGVIFKDDFEEVP